MNRIHVRRAIVFACSLAFMGSLIFFFKHQRDIRIAHEQAAQQAAEQQAKADAEAKKAAAEAQKAAEAAAKAAAEADREKRLADMNTNIVRKTGEEMIAVACASENGTLNSAISDELATHFARKHIKFVSSFFRPTMIKDGTFNSLFDGSKATFDKMELQQSLDGLLLAKQDVGYTKNEALDGLVTADMHLQIVTLPVAAQIESQSWTLSAKGTGFNNADARMQAEERIIKQIKDDTKMSLSHLN